MREVTDIEDFFELGVEDKEYLQICNRLIDARRIIDFDSLIDYMREQNVQYCVDNELCEECRSPLQEREQIEEVCGSRMVIGRYLICPNNC